MATVKLTRDQQYREIVYKAGKRWEDCKVLGFVFKAENGPERFHYQLLLEDPRPAYYLFDCFGTMANVVVADDPGTIQLIQDLAERVGGNRTTPNLR